MMDPVPAVALSPAPELRAYGLMRWERNGIAKGLISREIGEITFEKIS